MRSRKIAFTAVVALLFGGAAIYVAHRVKRSHSQFSEQGATISVPAPLINPPVPHPGVKKVYLGRTLGRKSDGLEEQVSLVVFYEDGQWGRITPMISPKGRKLNVRCQELCTAESGSWHDDGLGNVRFVSNTFICPICPLLREDVTRRPIEELWHYHRGNLSNSRGRVIGEVETYELLDTSRLADYQSVYLPFDLKDVGIIL